MEDSLKKIMHDISRLKNLKTLKINVFLLKNILFKFHELGGKNFKLTHLSYFLLIEDSKSLQNFSIDLSCHSRDVSSQSFREFFKKAKRLADFTMRANHLT